MPQVTGRCMRCRESRTVEVEDRATMKNGAVRLWGPCPVCKTNVNTIMSAAKAGELK